MTRQFLISTTLFAPFIGFLLSLVLHRRSEIAKSIACSAVIVSLICYFLLVRKTPFGHTLMFDLLMWIKLDPIKIYWGVYIDPLSTLMTGVVLIISCLVHIYSLGYMAHDESLGRFMSYLNLFTFTMLLLVLSPNLLQLFVGWEGVGLSSYLLIGFWYEKKQASQAAFKAFIINRAADIALILAILSIYVVFETLEFSSIEHAIPNYRNVWVHFMGYKVQILTLIASLIMIGAMAKSAQFGFHTWLPDAMEGPTPVSALIHAATMVTAGVFLIVRFSILFEYTPLVKDYMVVIGALTAFFAATVALTQKDIKRVIAYSTCSQLGYMFLACGCGAYTVAMFHLITHAFFKALLFLGAGSVIHAMSDEQNIFKMGGIYKFIPKTYAMMWIGSLALAGIPFFSGYYSKDLILESVYFSNNMFALGVALFVVFLTAFYSWRVIRVVFHGKPNADEQVMAHIHEVPKTMMIPMMVLAIGAIISGWLGYQFLIKQKWGFNWGVNTANAVIKHGNLPFWMHYSPALLAVLGIIMSFIFYKMVPQISNVLGRGWLYNFSNRKWFIDELYHYVFVKPALWLSEFLAKTVDMNFIDRYGPNGVVRVVFKISRFCQTFHTGYLYHYALVMLIAVIVAMTIYFLLFIVENFQISDFKKIYSILLGA